MTSPAPLFPIPERDGSWSLRLALAIVAMIVAVVMAATVMAD